jgi:hypothetical protein
MRSDIRLALCSLLVLLLVGACADPHRVLDDESLQTSKRNLEPP